MLKWARDRFSGLTDDSDQTTDIVSTVGNQMPALAVAVATPATQRVVAISSVGFDAAAIGQALAAPKKLPRLKLLAPRRPGVHARWKEQNRLPIQSLS
ncbi:MAG: hypothetical protein LH481_00010 [Burkholderiales bacterium]|nr:hypothetical protein [Burkholderiales bacterium]